MKKTIRKTDKVFRYGGEEIVIWIYKAETNKVIQVSDKIRRTIESMNPDSVVKGLTIALSLGVTSVQEDDTAENVFNRADRALYRAKKNGRNQVSFEK